MTDGGLWWKAPISAFCKKEGVKELPLNELMLWDSFSYNVSVTTFYELAGATMQYTSRRKVKRKGKYLFTIDWCAGDFNELNFGYAEKPDQHKCGHVLQLEDGNFAIQSNNSLKIFRMSDKFKAIVLNEVDGKFSRELKTLDKSFLKDGDVLVKIDFSNLNYKDALILKNGGKLVKEYPHIPGIDFSGKVIESDNPGFKPGDNVVVTGCRVGEIYPGGYSQIAKVKSEFLIKTPKEISNKNAFSGE